MSLPIQSETQAQAMIAAAPTAAPPSEPGASKTGIPSQKIIAGSLAGIVAWTLLAISAHFGFDVQHIADGIFASLGQTAPDAQAIVSGVVAAAIGYYVPSSQRDMIEHLTDEVVHAAMRDPETNVSSALPPTMPEPGKPAMVVPPATKA